MISSSPRCPRHRFGYWRSSQRTLSRRGSSHDKRTARTCLDLQNSLTACKQLWSRTAVNGKLGSGLSVTVFLANPPDLLVTNLQRVIDAWTLRWQGNLFRLLRHHRDILGVNRQEAILGEDEVGGCQCTAPAGSPRSLPFRQTVRGHRSDRDSKCPDPPSSFGDRRTQCPPSPGSRLPPPGISRRELPRAIARRNHTSLPDCARAVVRARDAYAIAETPGRRS